MVSFYRSGVRFILFWWFVAYYKEYEPDSCTDDIDYREFYYKNHNYFDNINLYCPAWRMGQYFNPVSWFGDQPNLFKQEDRGKKIEKDIIK